MWAGLETLSAIVLLLALPISAEAGWALLAPARAEASGFELTPCTAIRQSASSASSERPS